MVQLKMHGDIRRAHRTSNSVMRRLTQCAHVRQSVLKCNALQCRQRHLSNMV